MVHSHVERSSSNARDVAEQPADVSFALDEVLALDEEKGSRLFRAVDEDRIGAGGLSLGGATAYGVAFSECCRDDRLVSAAVLNGIRISIGDNGDEIQLDGHIPLLIAHSDTDPLLSYESARAVFSDAQEPVWFVTLYGASHATQWEDTDTPYDDVAEQITLDFWDATLKGKKKAFKQLEEDATVPDLSSIEVRR